MGIGVRLRTRVGCGFLAARTPAPGGQPTGVRVLLVAGVELQPVGMVDMGLPVGDAAEVRSAHERSADALDEPVAQRQVHVEAVHVVAGRHGVGAVEELEVLDGPRRLRHETVTEISHRLERTLRVGSGGVRR